MSNTHNRNRKLYEYMVGKYGKAAVENAINALQESDSTVMERRDKKLYESLVRKYGARAVKEELSRINESKTMSVDEILIVD